MVFSMTGFGKSVRQYPEDKCIKQITVEVRSLNSKFIDMTSKIPDFLRSKDIEIRKIATEKLNRGKVDISIIFQYTESHDAQIQNSVVKPINPSVFNFYYNQLKGILTEQSLPFYPNIVSDILAMPGIHYSGEEELTEDDWQHIKTQLDEALQQVCMFRKQEGEAMHRILLETLKKMEGLFNQIAQYEKSRIDNIKNRLTSHLKELSEATSFTINDERLETEMIYYLEKLDITEEKDRLTNHIQYFKETLEETDPIGKKLSFIAQEMGREINTLGSKANQTDMQVIVVQMKDLLEQMKEQILNIL